MTPAELDHAREEIVNVLLDAIALAEHIGPDDAERALARALTLRDVYGDAVRATTRNT